MIESIIYDESYGTIVEHKKTVETYNPYCYTGREFDSHDLYYYRARYYDPTSQRFLSPDPIEFMSGDYNFYRYVGNEPINYVDALGLKKCASAKTKKKLNKLTKKLQKKLSKALVKRLGVMVASAATGVGIVVTIDGAIWTAYELWNSKEDIFELYDLLTSDELGLSTDDMIGAVSAIATGADPLPKCNNANDKKDGAKVKGKKPRRKCGEKQKHKDSGSETKEERNAKPRSEKMDSDHIPSQEHVKRDIDNNFSKQAKSVRDCMKKQVSENMETIMLPNDIHSGAGAKTAQTQPNTNAYKDWAKDFKATNGKDPSLHEIAMRETEVIEKEIDKKGRANDPCGKKIKETLKDFKNLDKDYFKNLYKEALKNCKGK
ncbi:RHS repeat-associated core domain-containing protein [Campylobacterota bacterium DY0563]